jgi:hypothetical protein
MPAETPESTRAMHVQSIKARVARADYVVDPAAVADAILRRSELGRDLASGKPVRRRAHSPRGDARGPHRRG